MITPAPEFLTRASTFAEHALTAILAASIAGALVIALILLARLAVRDRLRAWVWGALWVVVLIRLILPWSPGSPLSIQNLQRVVASNFNPSELSHLTGLDAAMDRRSAPTPSIPNPIAREMQRANAADRASTIGAPLLSSPSSPPSTSPALPSGNTLPPAQSPTLSSPSPLWPIAAMIWLVGVLIVLSRLLAARRHADRIVESSRPVTDQSILELLECCRAAMRIPRIVALRHTESPALIGACVVGTLQPLIILSTKSLRSLSTADLRAVLLHELAHIRRADLAVGWLWGIALTVHWFNPLAWLAAACMRRDREIACDQAALEATAADDRLGYGRTLLKVAESALTGPREHLGARPALIAALIGIGGDLNPSGDGVDARTHMLRRCSMIARFRPSSRLATLLGLGAIALVALTGLTGPVTGAPPSKAKDNAKTNVVESHTTAFELYFKPYDKTPAGHIAVPNVELVAMPEYHGVSMDGKMRTIDKRFTLVVQDSKNSFWPVIMRLSKDETKAFFDALDHAARSPIKVEDWANKLAGGDAAKANKILAEVIASEQSRGPAILNMRQNNAPIADGNMVTIPAGASLLVKAPGEQDHRATIWITADGKPQSWYAVVYADQTTIIRLRDQAARILKLPIRHEGGDDSLAPKLFTKNIKLNEHSYGDLAPNSSFKVEARSKAGGQLAWIKLSLIDGTSGQVAAQIGLDRAQAMRISNDLTTLLRERSNPSTTTGTMTAGIGAKPYAMNDDGSVNLPESLTVKILPSYHGVNLDGTEVVDNRILIVANDAEARFWPILARMDDDVAQRLATEIDRCLAPKKP